MRILIVASYNKEYFAPFIVEQADALQNQGCEMEYFGVKGKGIVGYLKELPILKRRIKTFGPDIIHAHYGLCGLLANLQRKVPVITTYHGSDINEKFVLPFSKISMLLSRHNIFVSQRNIDIAKPHEHFSLIPCGVSLDDLQLTEKVVAREKMGLEQGKQYVLFAGAFDNRVKNYPLAKAAMDFVPEAELIELKGYSREQVTLLMCACDALLMTSFSEGSPQVVKEAMACGCPVVSVDVGDVPMLIDGIEGCYVSGRDAESIAGDLAQAFKRLRVNGRVRLIENGYDNSAVSAKILSVYKSVR